MSEPGTRYVAFVDRHRRAILFVSLAILVGSSLLARRLSVKTELATLLPPGERSVRDLRAIEARSQIFGNLLVGVASGDPARREAVARRLTERLAALPPDLVGTVVADDAALRAFAWEHRFLYAPLADLVSARDAIEMKKLAANPLYVDLEHDDAAPADLDALRRRLRQAEEDVRHPKALVSRDGTLQMVIVEAPFAAAELERCLRLRQAVDRVIAETREPGVELGAGGDVRTAAVEHDAILSGMRLTILVTCLLVGLGLLLYYRSPSAIFALLYALAVGAMATFGFTRLAIGHLNSATAFLASIVIGNGINFPLILLARYLEERRGGRRGRDALVPAVAFTARGTLCAALAAGIAYASLVVTSFRGFRDFGVIGGVGMALCWLSAYTVLPALILVLEDLGQIRWTGRAEPALGRLLARLLPRRLGTLLVGGFVLTAVSAFATFHYLAEDPFEYSFRALASSDPASLDNRRWMDRFDRAFGKGIAGNVVVAVDERAQAAAVAEILRRARDASGRHVFAEVGTLDDVLPAEQGEKLAVLEELRALLDDDTLALLEPDERADAARFRPPPGLRALGDADVPDLLARRFTEKDGTRGRLVFASAGPAIDPSNGKELVRMARLTRALPLPAGAHVAGTPFIWADVILAIKRDGPRATLAALLGVTLFTALVIGLRRHGLVTLAAAACGALWMLAACDLFSVRINFLDFVAFPITLGIGVDYAANVAARARLEGRERARRVVETTGSAVVLCSFTTMVGYGSLLLSPNAGIRSFGLTAILGEVTCLLAAVVLAPALLEVLP